jgi:hypothetical protein
VAISSSFKMAGAAAALVLMASAPQAATIDFSGGAAGGVGFGGITYAASATATGILQFCGASVSVSANGLGVNGCPDTDPGQIDGFPIFSAETLTITFSKAVKLVDFTLALLDGNDDMEWSINGGSFTQVGAPIPTPIGVGQKVTSFSIRASGVLFADGWFGNDDFTLKGATVAPVPLPAAGLLLVGGIGGLAALRRKRKAA